MLPLAAAPVAQLAAGADGRLALKAALANEKADGAGADDGAAWAGAVVPKMDCDGAAPAANAAKPLGAADDPNTGCWPNVAG